MAAPDEQPPHGGGPRPGAGCGGAPAQLHAAAGRAGRANPHLSTLFCVDVHSITITASQSKFLGFITFLLVLPKTQQAF